MAADGQKKPDLDSILNDWVGPWALAPTNEQDRRAAELARASIKLTKSASFISPVAVASIDILGIKNVLSKMSLEEVAERFVEPFYNLTSPAYGFGNVELPAEQLEREGYRAWAGIFSVSISDTILLARRPDWELGDRALAEANTVVELAKFVCKMIKINSNYGVPLRAAIAFGECLITIGEQHSLLGMATGEASAWERQQEWIGGMLTPSAVAALRDGADAAKRMSGPSFPKYPNALTNYTLPLKPDCPAPPEPQIALNWITSDTTGISFMFDGKLPDDPGPTAPADVRRKYENTIAFGKHCGQTPIPAVRF